MSNIAKTGIELISKNGPKLKLWFRKNGGTVLTVAGIITGAAAVGTAIYSTTKLEPIVDEIKAMVDDVESRKPNAGDKKAYYKELIGVYMKAGWKLAKHYGSTIALQTVSLASILSAKGVMDKRNAASAAALAIAERSFQRYRQHVIAEQGSEADAKYFFGDVTKKDIEYVESAENGKAKVKKEKVNVVKEETVPGGYGYSRYAFVFGPDCKPVWSDNLIENIRYAQAVQNKLTDRLRSRTTNDTPGYLTMAELKTAFGAKVEDEDLVAGWVVCDENDIGDDYISLNIGEDIVKDVLFCSNESLAISGIVIDPNCQGDITPYFGKKA